MGVLEEAETKAKEWLITKEIPIALRAGAAALVGLLASGKSIALLSAIGVTIDPAKLTATIVKSGTVLSVAALAHLTSGWVTHKANNPSLELQADKESPLKSGEK